MRKISNVFWITLALVILAVAYGAIAPDSFKMVTENMKNFITSIFWVVLLTCRFYDCAILPVFHRESSWTNQTRKTR